MTKSKVDYTTIPVFEKINQSIGTSPRIGNLELFVLIKYKDPKIKNFGLLLLTGDDDTLCQTNRQSLFSTPQHFY